MVMKLERLSKTLGEVLRLLPDEDLAGSTTKPTDALDFLFEIKVLFSLLVYLTEDGWVVEVQNRQGNRIILPRKPGRKANFSYFSIEHSSTGLAWQLVHGTQLEDPFGKLRAPDLSLQLPSASTAPTYQDIRAMWDAKLRGNDDGDIDIPMKDADYRSFVWVRDILRVPCPNDSNNPLDGWPPAFEVSGLITNGLGPTENIGIYINDGVSVTQHFQDANTPTYPSRRAHIEAHTQENQPSRIEVAASQESS